MKLRSISFALVLCALPLACSPSENVSSPPPTGMVVTAGASTASIIAVTNLNGQYCATVDVTNGGALAITSWAATFAYGMAPDPTATVNGGVLSGNTVSSLPGAAPLLPGAATQFVYCAASLEPQPAFVLTALTTVDATGATVTTPQPSTTPGATATTPGATTTAPVNPGGGTTPVTGATATLKITNDWGQGYCATVDLQNSGSTAVTDWTVTLNLGGATVQSSWGSIVTGSTFTPNGDFKEIAPGSTLQIGFCANGAAGTGASLASSSFVGGSGNTTTPDGTTTDDTTTGTTNPGTTNTGTVPVTGGQPGWASRYWDCCMPHCAWKGNGGTTPVCTASGAQTTEAAKSACSGGSGYMCKSMAPRAISDALSYGYVATNPASCGACYRIQFTGKSHNAGNDAGSASLAGKQMIVEVTNTGGDVGSGQMDLLIPGGGVGAFNACSNQWGVSTADLGAQYGGFLTTCKQQSTTYATYKSCVLTKCNSVFANQPEMKAGCQWFVNWYGAADNPAFTYETVACPAGM